MATAIRILYVDDDSGLLDIAKQFLERSGNFEVTTAISVPEAFRLLEQKQFDAIISDYQMPEIDGIQFLVDVRKRFGSIPFILFTGRGREEIVIQAINNGVDFYLQKGGDPEAQFAELSHKVRQAAFRKKAEDSLKESEEKYRQLVELAEEGIWAIDAKYNTTYLNPRMAEMLEYTVDEMQSLPLTSFMDDAGKIIFAQNMERRRQGITEVHPFEFITKGGKRIYVTISTSPLIDKRGAFQGSIAVISDVTGRMHAEDALRESEERFRILLMHVPSIAVQGYSMDGTANYWYDGAANLYGYSEEEAIGKNLVELIVPPEMREEVKKAIAYMAETGQPIPASELSLMKKDGSRVTVFSSHVIIKRSRGEMELYCLDIDLTERKRVEEALRQANKKLNHLSSITRHDINNQLTVQMGYLELLKDIKLNASQIEYFQNVATAAQRIANMIEFAKEYECIGFKAPAWQDCRILADTAAKDAPLGEVMVKNELPAGTEVFADPLIAKVFYNLMDNAARYGKKITKIRFSLERSGDDHLIVCEDDGDGVVAEEKEKIFERGFGKNTGLGLFLSREILSITDITIRETGEPGKGARFEMTVPKGMYRLTDVQPKTIAE